MRLLAASTLSRTLCSKLFDLPGLACLFVLSLASAEPAAQMSDSPQRSATRPKIGVVLSGGGARGVAHIGVLKVLDEMRIPIDYIVGTSMGAIVAGSYSVGMSPQKMEARIRAVRWEQVLADQPARSERSYAASNWTREIYMVRSLASETARFCFPPVRSLASTSSFSSDRWPGPQLTCAASMSFPFPTERLPPMSWMAAWWCWTTVTWPLRCEPACRCPLFLSHIASRAGDWLTEHWYAIYQSTSRASSVRRSSSR